MLTSRQRAYAYAPNASDKWHAQLAAYQVMPANELLCAQQAELTLDLQGIISQHGLRVVCEDCGEDIINEREMRRDGHVLCRACAEGAYYTAALVPFERQHPYSSDYLLPQPRAAAMSSR